MKKACILSSLALCAAPFAGMAAIIGPSTLNGSFESDDGSGTSSPDAQFANWTTGGNVEVNQRIDNNATNGTWSAVIGSVSVSNDRFGVIQNTGYEAGTDFGLSESYDLTFDWANAFNWDSDDTVDWRIFTSSDNTLTGTLTIVDSGSFTDDNNTILTYENEAVSTATITGASSGQELWIEFYSASAALEGNNDGEFARLDNITLTAVPEPSTYALLSGLLALTCVMIRRRLS